MFNLEKSIAGWREQMLAAGIKTPVPLEELEIHLREEIQRQTKAGRNETEAFQCAVQSVGSARMIQNEFERVEEIEAERQWKDGLIWSGAILGLLQLILIGAVLFNAEMTLGQRVSGLAAIATSFVLVGVGRVSHRIFPANRLQRAKSVLIFILGDLPGMIWIVIFYCFFLLGHEFPFGHYLATLLWANCPPLTIFLGLIWGSLIAARNKSQLHEIYG